VLDALRTGLGVEIATAVASELEWELMLSDACEVRVTVSGWLGRR